jgi:hypothetical protein
MQLQTASTRLETLAADGDTGGYGSGVGNSRELDEKVRLCANEVFVSAIGAIENKRQKELEQERGNTQNAINETGQARLTEIERVFREIEARSESAWTEGERHIQRSIIERLVKTSNWQDTVGRWLQLNRV